MVWEWWMDRSTIDDYTRTDDWKEVGKDFMRKVSGRRKVVKKL